VQVGTAVNNLAAELRRDLGIQFAKIEAPLSKALETQAHREGKFMERVLGDLGVMKNETDEQRKKDLQKIESTVAEVLQPVLEEVKLVQNQVRPILEELRGLKMRVGDVENQEKKMEVMCQKNALEKKT